MKNYDTVNMSDDGLLRIESYDNVVHISIHTDKNHVGRDMNKEDILKLIKILINSL